jgi:hypothetical protein
VRNFSGTWRTALKLLDAVKDLQPHDFAGCVACRAQVYGALHGVASGISAVLLYEEVGGAIGVERVHA